MDSSKELPYRFQYKYQMYNVNLNQQFFFNRVHVKGQLLFQISRIY